jgi:hypothetical protein
MRQQQEHQKRSDERHIFREIDRVDLLHLRIIHLPVVMHLERHTQKEDDQQNDPGHRIDAQQHAETAQQQDDSGSCHRQLRRRCPPRFRVLTHVVEILEVVETGHQPITAKNDPSDQESDVHLGSFLSATLLDDHALISATPVTFAAKAAGFAATAIVQFGSREIGEWLTI